MRVIRFRADDGRVLHGEAQGDDADCALVLAGSIADGFERTGERARVVELLAPLEPREIICIGRNYCRPDAASDDGRDKQDVASSHSPSSPSLRSDDAALEVFLKPACALQGPNQPIHLPCFENINPQLDCEGELAIVIGKRACKVSEAGAMQCIFGYTIANDVTARHFQTPAGPPLWMRGKGFPSFCPLGPAIVTRDEIADPDALAIHTRINGQVVRSGNTRQMIRSTRQIVAALSRHMPLEPGTVLLTGSPQPISGVSRDLQAGDRVEIEIAGIGQLQNFIQ